MKPLLAVYPSHDASVAVRTVTGEYRVFEIERYTKERFCSLLKCYNYRDIYQKIHDIIKDEYGAAQFDSCHHMHLNSEHQQAISDIFKTEKFKEIGHHIAHAAASFYQSPFTEALIVSYDGGGLDGGDGDDRVTYFNIYHGHKNNGIKRLGYIQHNLGTAYGLTAIPISEISKTEENWGDKFLSFAGKLMGLVAYGKVRDEWLHPLIKFYKQHKHTALFDLHKSLSEEIGIKLDINVLSGQDSYDFAASSQRAFEIVAFEGMEPYLIRYPDLPLCLTGGCALNVIFNQKLKDTLNRNIFIPPNPSDCGLALGMLAHKIQPKEPIQITYSGWPILDLNDLSYYIKLRNAKQINTLELVQLLNQGKIIGVMRGNSEHGPRALGHRSILCNPAYQHMKDTLNAKVKFREWFRPFAPIVRAEDVEKYFEFNGEAQFMTFSPKVKTEWMHKIPSVIHEDGTARIQTVTKEQEPFIYELLTEKNKYGPGVILNTSFNIKGKPILTTISDALEVLDTTEIDGVLIENFLFERSQ